MQLSGTDTLSSAFLNFNLVVQTKPAYDNTNGFCTDVRHVKVKKPEVAHVNFRRCLEDSVEILEFEAI